MYQKKHVMHWQGTLEQMKAAGGVAICICTCGWCVDVDLDEMIGILGADGSLWDRKPPCERDDCDRLAHFMCAPGKGTAMRPMLSQVLSTVDLPMQAWMGGWTGIEPVHERR